MDDDGGRMPPGDTAGSWLWRFADAELDDSRLTLTVRGQPVELDYKSIEVLRVLLQHAGEVVTKDELFGTVWAGRVTVEGVLTNAISRLRKALGDEVIATQHRVGYRLTVPVTRRRQDALASELRLRAGDPVPGRTAWTLLRALGSGGEGEVWLAGQAKTGEQRVFKFARDAARLSSLKREATLYRLLRQVLGEREDFARVLEWNFEAPPFFLECEYGGPDLADWARAQGGIAQVPLPERLRLMAGIADAVAAAHGAGVLHKDLKPGNVLVYAEAGGMPQPRLTDFGSSRLLDATGLDAAGITRLGFTETQAASNEGTPLYLAPELMAGQLPTVRSDVYALGILLYQLVVGDLARPLVAGREQDVADPLLREDIALAAHGKPAERMESAEALARRLRTLETRRAAASEQTRLAARAHAAEDRLQRARARRPYLVALGLVLVAGLLLSTTFFVQASQARDTAERQARIAATANAFLNEELVAQANPSIGGRSNITVLDAAKAARAGIAARFAGEAEIEATLHRTLAGVFDQLGDYPLALEEYQIAQQLLDGRRGSAAVLALVNCYEAAQTMGRNAQLDLAAKHLAHCDRQAAAAGALDVRVQYRSEHVRGRLAMFAYDTATAITRYETARALLGELPDQQREREDFVLRQNLAAAYSLAGRYPQAEQLLHPLIAELEPRFGLDHYSTLDAKTALAQCLLLQERHAEALALYEALDPVLVQKLGENHQVRLQTLGEMGYALAQLDRWQPAVRTLRDAHGRLQVSLGDTHLLTLITESNLAAALQYGDGLAEAIRRQRHVREELGRQMGDLGPMTQIIRFNLADMLLMAGDARSVVRELDGLKASEMAAAGPASDWQARLDIEHGRGLWLLGDPVAGRARIEAALSGLNSRSPDSRRIGDAAKRLVSNPV